MAPTTDRVFVTGMFRSGTTLLAHMLAAHPEVAFASDPFAPLFKEFRNAVADGLFGADRVDHDAPLDDYYFYPDKQRLFEAVQAASLTLSAESRDAPTLGARLAGQARAYAPKVAPHLDRLAGRTFADLIESGLAIVRAAYGDGKTALVGFKEVWTGEFSGHLLAAFPGSRVVCMVRDPRAVCASKNVKAEKYPWLFLGRQWRKLAALAWLARRAVPERVMVLRYEDLVAAPEATARSICAFLGIGFAPEILDATRFRDDAGARWEQNSSYFERLQAFNPRSVAKWQEVLREDEVRCVESLCWPEMTLFGYPCERFDPARTDPGLVFAAPVVAPESLAAWIRPHVVNDRDGLVREMACEQVRTRMLVDNAPASPADKRRLCLSEALYDELGGVHGDATGESHRAAR